MRGISLGLSILLFIYSMVLIYKESRVDAGIVSFLILSVLTFSIAMFAKLIRRKYIAVISVSLLLIFLVFECFIGLPINHVHPQKDSQLIIVFGCGLKDGNASDMLKYRLNRTLSIYEKNMKIIVTGGLGKNEQKPEAQVMAEYLIEKGVPKNDILLEDKATSTYENLKYSKNLLTSYGLNNKDIIMVTSDFHMNRTLFLAERTGIDGIGVKAETPILNIPQAHVREYLAIMKSILFDK